MPKRYILRSVNSALALCPPPGSHSQGGQGQGKRSANPGLSCPGLWVLRQPTRNVQLPLTSYPRPGCLGFGLLSIWGVTYDSAKIWEPTEKGPVLQAINGDMSNLGNRAARTGPTEVCHSALLSKLGLPPVPPHSSTHPSILPPTHLSILCGSLWSHCKLIYLTSVPLLTLAQAHSLQLLTHIPA